MAVSESQKIAIRKYRDKTYDTIGFDVKKGKREEYKQFAAKQGWSLAGLLTKATDDFIQNHSGEIPLPTPETKSLSPADEKLIAEFAKLPADGRKALLKLAEIINAKGGDKP